MMHQRKRFTVLGAVVLACALLAGGCVERLITVRSEPPGAIVWLNGEEIGTTPVSTSFTWYGQYEVILRKSGYETVKTARRAPEPFYQWPGVDLVAECLLPFTLTDRHEWDFTLMPQTPAEAEQLIQRARMLQDQTIGDL